MTLRTARTTRLARLALPALLAAGMLVGCTAEPGIAARVQFTDSSGKAQTVEVSERDLQAVSEEIAARGIDPGQTLSGMVRTPILEDAAGAYGIEVTDDEVRQFLASQGVSAEGMSSQALAVMRINVLGQEISQLSQEEQAAITDKAQATWDASKKTISPRYDTQPWMISNPAQTQQAPQQ